LNEAFVKHVTTGLPFTTVKAAMSIDGKIATAKGESRWISGEKSRARAHRLRAESDAIMVGLGTVVQDDPLLSVRTSDRPRKRQPLKVIVDSRCGTPPGARVLSPESPGKTLIAATTDAPRERVQRLSDRGAEVLLLPPQDGHVDLRQLMGKLTERGIVSLVVEGGSRLLGELIREGLADKIVLFVAPKIIGGQDAPSLIGGKGRERLAEAVRLVRTKARRSGEDVMITGYLEYPPKP